MTNQQVASGEFPQERIIATDGMAVTAEVWNEVHEHQRQWLTAHTHHIHGRGIITGLTVAADGPPKPNQIRITAGVAVDSVGQTIIYPEDRVFELQDQTGLLYIVLTYGESAPAPKSQHNAADAPHYIKSGFKVEAVARPDARSVELARLFRTDPAKPIENAKDAEQPGPQELDLRFRHQLIAPPLPPMAIALVGLEANIPPVHWQGWHNLVREVRHTGIQRLWVQRNVLLNQELSAYPMVCLTGQRGFTLKPDDRNRLHAYVNGGGVIYYESCRRELRDPGADKSILDLINAFNGKEEEIKANHTLYSTPYVFTQLPEGYDRPGSQLRIMGGSNTERESMTMCKIGRGLLIISRNDYSCVWSGERRAQRLTRTELREAFEWGANLITFALQQYQLHH